MRLRIVAACLAAACFGVGVINSQERAIQDDSDLSSIEEISEIRSQHGLPFLSGQESDQLFREALQKLVAEKGPRKLEQVDTTATAETRSQADDELCLQLRDTAALLDARANRLEGETDYLSADKLRNLAQLLRLEARSIMK
ncbi:MAG: hypothetical protein KDB27_11495 [Planctomycetales bacterium]|nr:hypothetical protein [Planctomycetales bacterium]